MSVNGIFLKETGELVTVPVESDNLSRIGKNYVVCEIPDGKRPSSCVAEEVGVEVPSLDEEGNPILDEQQNPVVTVQMQWQAVFKAEKEDAAKAAILEEIRVERDRKIAETDWVALSDVVGAGRPFADEAAREPWLTYRQTLRDVPGSIDWGVVFQASDYSWPEEPGE